MLLFDQTATTGVSTRLLDLISAEEAVSLCGLLLERVARTPDAVAYIQYDEAACADLDRDHLARHRPHGRALAGGLDARGSLARRPRGPHDAQSARMGRLRSGRARSGLVTVPLYPDDRAEAIRHILDDAGVRLLLLETAEQRAELSAIDPTLARLKRLLVLEPGDTPCPRAPGGERVARRGADPGRSSAPSIGSTTPTPWPPSSTPPAPPDIRKA
jgi:long-chain acyl-CoA synthetase